MKLCLLYNILTSQSKILQVLNLHGLEKEYKLQGVYVCGTMSMFIL